MATTPKSKSPQYPGSGQPNVPQPGQFVNPAPSLPSARAAVQGNAVRHVAVEVPRQKPNYVDPALFSAGVFKNREDYETTIKSVIARIRSGKAQPREPDVDE